MTTLALQSFITAISSTKSGTAIRVVLCLLASSCKHHSATGKIQDLPYGLVYEGDENLSEICEVVRMISLPDGREAGSATIIIPGDVLWCEVRENKIIGEKASRPRPVEWMDSNWERAGFFILNPAAFNSEAPSDEEKFGKAISWFATRQELETAIESTQRR